jgi:hypothetical protein
MQITLTGEFGFQSTSLSSLFSSATRMWNFVPQLTQPIFTAGRISSGVELTEATQRSALAQYEKAIQTAFRDVSYQLAQTKMPNRRNTLKRRAIDMHYPLPTIPDDLETLRIRLRQTRDVEQKQRLHLLVLIGEGRVESRREAADHLAVHRNSVGRWLAC